ncbi:GntR family transcriptional regulator [Ktedonobacter racemifer]|uniref:Transcriptional regulator, GntR family with LacI sensor n=1 Tax=Ktedonobacter racemifer DSM 44963 TaxID=485913 RepID=D6TWS3_KTERA|nr:GntR family transcriptional regulator [Ktedonobacter racemifer]EFH84656.1 transcriptional regulator, GntR family with LacI sensor [Ktedonobacter racemifer DSM 44963]
MQESKKSPHSQALYSQILNEIREHILSGDLAVGTRLPPEAEIAQQHQTSRGTVRQALSILVTEGLLERIQGSGTFVRKLPSKQEGKQQQPPAKKNVGLILSQAGDELNMDILLGVEQVVKPRGYQLSFAYAEEDPQALAFDIARLRANTVGLIIFPISNSSHDSSIEQLKTDSFPFVLVDRYIPEIDCDYVVSDNIGGGYRGTEHLLILGHTRIGFVCSSRGGLLTTSVRDRWEGYRKALKEYNQVYDESLVYHNAPTPAPDPPNVYDDIMTSADRPSAFLAVNDAVALGLLQAAQRHRIRVPEDVALVGFDDVSYAAHLSVPLTTIAQQRKELGGRAGTLLINRIEGQVVGTPKHIQLPTNLIIRQSCGARLRISSSSFDGRE